MAAIAAIVKAHAKWAGLDPQHFVGALVGFRLPGQRYRAWRVDLQDG
jgi:hypothetical protein